MTKFLQGLVNKNYPLRDFSLIKNHITHYNENLGLTAASGSNRNTFISKQLKHKGGFKIR